MEILFTVLIIVPYIVILWSANLADRWRGEGRPSPALAGLTYALLLAVYGRQLLVGFLLHFSALLSRVTWPAGPTTPLPFGSDPATLAAALDSVGLGLWLPPLVGLLLLLPPVRRLLARVLPIDPARTVHAVALWYTTLVVSYLCITLGIGLKILASVAETGEMDVAMRIGSTWAQDLLFVLTGLVGVGWLSRRSLRQALERLGLAVPRLGQVGIGLGVGLALVPAAMAAEALASRLGIGPNVDVEKLTEALLGPLFRSIPGILTLGLAAALGEETIFRGALQPRLGLLPTAAVFALLHTQYGFTLSTLIVLVIGLVLGLVRARVNLTASMLTHAAYNITLGLMAYLQLPRS